MSVRSNSGHLGGGVVRRDARRTTLPQGKLVEYENKCEKKRWLGKAEGGSSVDLHNDKLTTPGNAKKSNMPRPPLKQGRLVLGS